jgi:N-acetylated-alpha-linked acidic dipeptidase
MAPASGSDAMFSPPIPSYDEAIAAADDRVLFGNDRDAAEAHALLSNGRADLQRPTRSNGYAPPTVETDDEDSGWEDELDNALEADQVRREMQDLEVIDMEEEDGRSRTLIWRKRMGFARLLPRLRWRWRDWQLPRLRRTIRLGDSVAEPSRDDANNASITPATRQMFPFSNITARTTVVLACRALIIIIVLGLLYLLFMSDLFTNMARRMGGRLYDPESVRTHVQSSVDGRQIADRLRHLTSYAHLAGSEGDFALASDIRKEFHVFGLEDVAIDEYTAYLNYPTADGRAVEIIGQDGEVKWSAKIEEQEQGEAYGHQTYVFHGHSRSGEAQGPLMYANYGTRQDFKRLHDSGINTRGAIALVRQGGQQPNQALKVKAAELAGFAGCIIYTDPADNGFVKGATVPDGRYMPADGVQRGSVSMSNVVMGDLLTPEWESKQGLPRLEPNKSTAMPGIPSLPLAWRDAQVLLQGLNGHGESLPQDWVGGVPEVGEQWWSGDRSSPIVRIKNYQDEVEAKPIWNVYAKIAGVEQTQKRIIIGNRRDSFGLGASSPHSGTAIMLEMARILGDLLAKNWRPLRTIEFMSWDGSAYNLIGSTEYVERTTAALRADGFAYINLDSAVTGTEFHASGSPMFKNLLLQLMKRVAAPLYNVSLRDVWDRRGGDIGGMLDAESDYAPFLNIAGVSSLDIHFSGDPFPQGSSYDTFNFVESVADPGFELHNALGQLLALLIVELADRPVLPFDMNSYGDSIVRWVDELDTWVADKGANTAGNPSFDLSSLREAASAVKGAVQKFVAWEAEWEQDVLAVGGYEPMGLGNRRLDYNNRMSQFETNLLDLASDGGVSVPHPTYICYAT